MPKGTLEVGMYEPPVAVPPAYSESDVTTGTTSGRGFHVFRRPLYRYGLNRYSVSGAGALASLLLHILLIASMTWGGGLMREPSQQRPDMASPHVSADAESDSAMELVWVEEPDTLSTGSPDSNAFAAPTLATVTVDASLAAVSIPALSAPDEIRPTPGDGNSAAQAILLGRYVGQIDARIERAWRRPRTPLKEDDFSCRVRIVQDATGAVQEITLERCNGDTRWQLSLVHAIQLASPLPAPPDPKVFTRVLRMNFRAQPYSPQSPQEDYEPALVANSAR